MRASSFLLGTLFFVFASPSASAQNDVCCIMAKVSGDGVESAASVMSSSDCQGGKTTPNGYTVCSSFADENNSCPTTTEERRCGLCGYHWAGTACLKEDPVKKAKEELEKEQKLKETNKKKEPPSPTTKKAPGS